MSAFSDQFSIFRNFEFKYAAVTSVIPTTNVIFKNYLSL